MIRVALIFSLAFVSGCGSPRPTPRPDLNGLLRQSVNSRRDPSLGGRWLASLGQRNGRERVELIDLRSRSPVPLPGLNRADAQPISVSVSADGQRLAVVQQREDRTELVLYRRNVGATQRLSLIHI